MERNAFNPLMLFGLGQSLSTAINTIERNSNNLVSYIAMFVYFTRCVSMPGN
jgi:hypothetical protein